MSTHERPFPISKEGLDTLNSLSWFLMDAAWMTGAPGLAKVMAPVVLLSAFALTYIDRRRNVMLINMAIVCWILMNISWMIAEMMQQDAFHLYAKICFALGLACVALAALLSTNLKDTFSHFRRFRLMKRL